MSDVQARVADKLVACFAGFVASARPGRNGDSATLRVRVAHPTADFKDRLWACLWTARESVYPDDYSFKRIVDEADAERPRVVVVFGSGIELAERRWFDPNPGRFAPR